MKKKNSIKIGKKRNPHHLTNLPFTEVWRVFLLIFFFISCHSDVEATPSDYTYSPSQASDISAKTFEAGDIIILENGNWNNKNITIKGTGTAGQPITVKARQAGQVNFTGSSRLTIDGKYIEVSGIKFTGNTTVGKNHVITFSKNSSNCRLTNSAILNYNPADNSIWAGTDNKWISLHGINNRVDHCYFEGKANIGTLLVVWLVEGVTPAHKIDNNHFYKRIPLLDEEGKELNGQETIRIGDSSTSMTNARCIIESNYFEECNGEIEIISNKSCGNIYRNNVFYNNNGMLTLRHGNSCEVYGNYFFGRNQSGSGGVRIIGENHKVYNNYFQDIKGNGYRTAICIVNGKTNSALSEYYQVKNASVLFNIFYNCENTFNIGYGGGGELAPESTTIAHNVIYATTNKQVGVKISDPASQIVWKNNLMYQGKHTSFSPTASQFARTTTNLDFYQADTFYGIFQPKASSVISTQYKTSEYPGISTDIEGRSRPEQKMIGAFELNGSPSITMPTPGSVGCTFINKDSTGTLHSTVHNSPRLIKNIVQTHNSIQITSEEQLLNLSVYNIQGYLLERKRLTPSGNNFTHIINLCKGIYMFVFDNEQIIDSHKIFIR